MKYEELAAHAQSLPYRDKLRLAQLLVQVARKEEEEANPDRRVAPTRSVPTDPELLHYVFDRLVKLKASKKESVINSMGAMFQFQGGISDQDKEKLFSELLAKGLISVAPNGRVSYRNSEA